MCRTHYLRSEQRQSNGEGRALALGAVDSNLAAVQVHAAPNDQQAKASSGN
jgi:hypothetical protein